MKQYLKDVSSINNRLQTITFAGQKMSFIKCRVLLSKMPPFTH